MAHTLDPMDLKQIITLHLDGLSNRQIGEVLNISRNTVNGYIKLFKACDHSFEELLVLDEPVLQELFPSHTTIVNDRYNQLMLYFEKVNHARNHPGFTFLYHYNEYKHSVSTPAGADLKSAPSGSGSVIHLAHQQQIQCFYQHGNTE